MSRTVAGTVLTKSRPGAPKASQSTKAWRRQARSSSSTRPWRAARPKSAQRALQVAAPRPAREALVAHDLPRLDLHDGLEGGPERPVVDDLQQRLALVALAEAAAQLGGRPRVLDQPQDLALLALERAVQDEAVADVDASAARAGRAGSGAPRAG